MMTTARHDGPIQPSGLTRVRIVICVVLAPAYAVWAQPTDTPNSDVYVTNGTVFAIVQSGTTIYLGGSFTMLGPNGGAVNIPRNNLAAIDATTGQVTAWDPNADGIVYALAVSGDAGTVYAGGQFTTVNGGTARNRIAAISASTGIATAWDADANNTVHALVLSGAVLYAGGDFTTIGGENRNRVAALATDTGLATGWDPDAGSTVKSLAIAGTSVYVGGSFLTIGGGARNRIAELDIGTGLATAWDPNANSTIETIVLSSDASKAYVGGWFMTIGGQARNFIAALDTAVDNNNATTWNPGANLIVNHLGISGDDSTVYAGGSFTAIGGQARNYIAALDTATDTNNALAWDPNPNSFAEAILVTSTNIMVGGWFTAMDGDPEGYFAYFGDLANAAPDAVSNLGPAGYVDGSNGTETSLQLTFSQSDANAGDTLSFRLQIDDDGDFSSPVLDYTSSAMAQGVTTFTVGQAAGAGAYTLGSAGQELTAGGYYWRVRSSDGALDGDWTVANSGNIAFVVTQPSVDFSAANYLSSESGISFTVTVQLDSISDETVRVDYASNGGTATAGNDYAAVSGTLIFDPGDVNKTFAVTLYDDGTDESDETISLILSTPIHATLAGANNPAILTLQDDDEPARSWVPAGITMAQNDDEPEISEAGLETVYSLVLDTRPMDLVTIRVTPDAQVDVGAGSGVSRDLSFTAANWRIPQYITLTAHNDDVAEGVHTSKVTHTIFSHDEDYDHFPLKDVVISIFDNDSAGVTSMTYDNPPHVTEGGETYTYWMVLDSEPTDVVTITVIPDVQCDVGTGPGQSIDIVFAPSDWSTFKYITVSAYDDDQVEDERRSILTHTIRSDDPLYANLSAWELPIEIVDNDVSPIVLGDIAVTISNIEPWVGDCVELEASIEWGSQDAMEPESIEFFWNFDAGDGIEEDAIGTQVSWCTQQKGSCDLTVTALHSASGMTATQTLAVHVQPRPQTPPPAILFDHDGTTRDDSQVSCGLICTLDLVFMLSGLMLCGHTGGWKR